MKKALILVAHADDESLGAGGLIQKLVKKDWEVSVVFLSNGILDVRVVIEDNREDANNACKVLGVKNPVFLDYKDQKFDSYPIADMANSSTRSGKNSPTSCAMSMPLYTTVLDDIEEI